MPQITRHLSARLADDREATISEFDHGRRYILSLHADCHAVTMQMSFTSADLALLRGLLNQLQPLTAPDAA